MFLAPRSQLDMFWPDQTLPDTDSAPALFRFFSGMMGMKPLKTAIHLLTLFVE